MDRERREWPAWLEPLRPDELSRARMRTAILGRAAPLLDARRLGSWETVAAGWARMLVPIAAVLLLLFAGLAYQAAPRTIAAAPVTLEELMAEDDAENTLAALTSSVEPSPDWALTTVMRGENGTPPADRPSAESR